MALADRLKKGWRFDNTRFNYAASFGELWEILHQKRRKTLQTCAGIIDIGAGQRRVFQGLSGRRNSGIKPGGLAEIDQILEQRKFCDPLVNRLAENGRCMCCHGLTSLENRSGHL